MLSVTDEKRVGGKDDEDIPPHQHDSPQRRKRIVASPQKLATQKLAQRSIGQWELNKMLG